jgi:hypothetical protein
MEGLLFQTATPPVRSDPARADIACFAGFVATRQGGAPQRASLERILRELGWSGPVLPSSTRVLPDNVVPAGDSPDAFASWIIRLGWQPSASAVAAVDLFRRAAAGLLGDGLVEWWVENSWLAPFSGRSAADLLELDNVPAPIDTWDAFDTLFAWDERPLVEGRQADTALGAAVRRFFLQGGRKCYVVRVGNPWPLFSDRETRAAFRSRVLETTPVPTAVDRSTWKGLGHLFGLTDVSFLCVPDLPELFAVDAAPIAPEIESEGEERFIECATRISPETSRSLRAFPAPRCDEVGFRDWAAFVASIGTLLQRNGHTREIEMVASVPLAIDEALLRANPAVIGLPPNERRRAVASRIFASRRAQREHAASIQTAFVQLVYPWLRTRESVRLPGDVEAPDALLAGLLANNALTQGTWRSAAREPVFGIINLEPALSIAELGGDLPYQHSTGANRLPRTMRERISIIAPTPTGFQLLSDVTTDDDESYRPANVNRLVASVVRAARLVGEDIVFANNGDAVWRRLRAGLEELLLGLWGQGALSGASAADAYQVRCDRSTMTPTDLDSGRIIARVQFTAASPIERITVVFAMDEGGHVTLVSDTSLTPV